MSLDGKTALILGFGQVGQRIGRACHALGMHVLALRRQPENTVPPVEYPVEIFGPAMLPQLLPRAHALIIALPATAATEALIGERELALLPPGAVLVNVGRGAIVDQVPCMLPSPVDAWAPLGWMSGTAIHAVRPNGKIHRLLISLFIPWTTWCSARTAPVPAPKPNPCA